MNKILCPNCKSENVFRTFKKAGYSFINEDRECTDEVIESEEINCNNCGCVFYEEQE